MANLIHVEVATRMQNEAYLRGVKSGICRYAFWNDRGVQVVGNKNMKLADALRAVDRELGLSTADTTGYRHVVTK